MKTIGLLGGMSWESTMSYYRLINTGIKERLGGLHSAKCVLYSVDFAEIESYQSRGDWDRAGELLGTKYTMQQDFYRDKLTARGIRVLIPSEEAMETINSVIFQELCLGLVSGTSRNAYLSIINRLARRGAQGILLGCTEIGLLLSQEDTPMPLFDTAVIHAAGAVCIALEK